MKCPDCGMNNPPGGQFCIGCGAALIVPRAPSVSGYAVKGVELLPGEEVVMVWGEMVLTDRRVVYRFASGCLELGGTAVGAALLEHIDSATVVRRRLLILLLAGCIFLVTGVFGLVTEVDLVTVDLPVLSADVDLGMIGLSGIGLIFILAHLLMPMSTLLLTVGGSPFVRQARFSLGRGARDVEQFVNRLFLAKTAR